MNTRDTGSSSTHHWHERILALGTVHIESIQETIVVDGITSTAIVRHTLGGQWTLGVLLCARVHETVDDCCNYPLLSAPWMGRRTQHTLIATLRRRMTLEALCHAGCTHSTRAACGAAHARTRVQNAEFCTVTQSANLLLTNILQIFKLRVG